MTRTCIVTLLAVLWAAAASAPARAQEAPELTGILTKNVLADDDRQKLQAFLEARVAAIQNGAEASKAASEIRAAYATGTPAFREATAALALDLFAKPIREGKLVPATQLLSILTTFNDVDAARLFQELLKDSRTGIRTAAAVGLRDLRKGLAGAGGAALSEAVDALRAAGQQETADVALREIYAALDYPEVVPNFADAKSVAGALLDILEARVPKYEAGEIRAPGADAAGLGLTGRLSKALGDPEKARLVAAAAKMLRSAVVVYTKELNEVKPETSSALQVQRRDAVEVLIIQAESLLSAQVKSGSPPSVAKAMQDSGVGVKQVTEMKLELNKWAEILKGGYNVDIHIED